MEKKDTGKKQILLRISPTLWKELSAWAEDDFRSINGQIEYLLTECVKKRKKKSIPADETENAGAAEDSDKE
ncbi:MAG: Arc family DNA-binding protein [Bacillota bacterium]|nr:Arc family DNA-binding protein [Bacillota bacterium]